MSGGGVAFYISDELCHSHPDISIIDGTEYICIDVCRGNKTSRICNVYRPPDSSADWLKSFRLLDIVTDTPSDVYCLGDFNIDFGSPDQCRLLKNVLKSFNLVQHVGKPTRVTATSSTNIDYFITRATNKATIHSIEILSPYASDHHIIFVQLEKPPHLPWILKTKWL